ncbi:MAG: NUDIX hydrolase [Gammaproteobacteria bacterium]|nr:NUDIX hydrolase [Gammaproteobacteria bacterium]MDE2252294.1 NUDIX hydrolase [Gammaproteobacteria bacterium]
MKYTATEAIEKLRPIFKGRVITVNLETVRLPNGHRAELEIVHHPGGAAVVAIDDERRVCLLRQYRHAIGGWIWELPAGKLEPAEPALTTARRELIEEAGVEAGEWLALGDYVTSPGVFTETVNLFLARRLRTVTMAHEAGELIEVHWIPFSEACRRALSGELADGKTALGLLRAQAVLAAQG